MKKKTFILLFEYRTISLYIDENNQITKKAFSNGKESLSNCVRFSYDKEDLEFLPSGDLFAIDSNSSFSDFLDFAGYHFECSEAIEAILNDIIKNKLIPGFAHDDDIIVCLKSFFFEGNDENKTDVNSIINFTDCEILGHKVYFYDFSALFSASAGFLREIIGTNLLFGYPFIAILIADESKDEFSVTFAPTMEHNVIEIINSKQTETSTIPAKLLRNVQNKILVAKLFNEPIPQTAVYQNRIVHLAKTMTSEMFDDLFREDSKFFLSKQNFKHVDKMFIFDYGMHPIIKSAYINAIKNPVYADTNQLNMLTNLLLRILIIEHTVLTDVVFRFDASRMSAVLKEMDAISQFGNKKYYKLSFVREYLTQRKKRDLFNCLEVSKVLNSFKGDI